MDNQEHSSRDSLEHQSLRMTYNTYLVTVILGVAAIATTIILAAIALRPEAPAQPLFTTSTVSNIAFFASPPSSPPPAATISPSVPAEPLSVGLTADNPVTSNSQWSTVIMQFESVEMVLVPIGCFTMGNDNTLPDEKPAHQICTENPYWIDRHEVANELFDRLSGQAVVESHFCDPDQDGTVTPEQQARCADRPRENITWLEARAFCELRSARLPTEAEWEYAVRGPDNLVYAWGNTLIANNLVYEGNSSSVAPVASKPNGISWVGAYDMNGNVWEWVSSIYNEDYFPYPYSKIDGRENPNDVDIERGLRGSSFVDGHQDVRASIRNSNYPANMDADLGFRCVRDFQLSDLQA